MKHSGLTKILLLALLLFFHVTEVAAAVTFVSRLSGTARNTGTSVALTLTLRSGSISIGDYMLTQLTLTSTTVCNSGQLVAPAGWTLLGCTASPAGVTQSQAIFGKVAVAGDAGKKYTWTMKTSMNYIGTTWVFRGVDPNTPIDAGPSVTTYSNTKSAAASNITTVTPGAMGVILISANVDNNSTFTPPSGWTEPSSERRCNATPSGCAAVEVISYATLANAGITSGTTTTLSNNQSGVVYLLALRPYSLVAYYPLDGTNWLADNSGYGYDGAANGSAAAGAGKICTGFSGGGSGWVTVANNTNQSFASSYAITAWVNPSSLPASGLLRTIISKETSSTSAINYDLNINSNGKLVWSWHESGGVLRSVTSTTSIPLNQWTHIAVVFDINAASLRQKIYINGVQDTSSGNFTVASMTTTASLYIGSTIGLTSGASNRNFAGVIDELRVYGTSISSGQVSTDMNATHACGVDHYQISTDGLGLTCQTENVAITACADTACSSYYAGISNVTLTTTSGSLSPATVSFAGGIGTSALSKTSVGTTTLGISSVSPAASGALKCFIGGQSVAMSACNVSFANDRFLIDTPDLTACLDEVNASITAESCGTVISGTQNVSFWATYSNPNTGTKIPKVNGTTIAMTTPGVSKSLVFDAAGTAPFTLNYPDAGQVILSASVNVGGATISGNTTFTSVPDSLLVYSTDPNAACTPASGSCTVFAKAGQGFPLKIKAACYSTLTDPATIPETPNFILSGIPLTVSPIAPTPNNPVTLGVTTANFAAADKGIATITQNISEVGVFQITATPPDYFGIALPVATSANIGRFTPDHFDTLVSEGSCSDGFSYSGQPFQTIATARNTANVATLNYDNTAGFAKTLTLSAIGASGAITGGDAGTPPSAQFQASHFSASDTTLAPLTPSFTFSASPSAPAAITIRASDTDGVSSNGYIEGSMPIRSGRLRLQNAYGSELLALPVSLEAQYWNGTSYVRNQLDSCTAVPSSSITMSNYRNNLSACETQLGYSSGTGAFVNGVAKYLRLTRPTGTGNNGSVDLSVNLNSATGKTCITASETNATSANIPWFGVNPVSRATFGIYKTPIIYMRENF